MVSPPMQLKTQSEERTTPQAMALGGADSFDRAAHARELGMWMRALRSFFALRNYPLLEATQSDLIAHDWTPEIRIVQRTLLRCSHLVIHLINSEKSESTIFDEPDAASPQGEFAAPGLTDEAEVQDDSFAAMAATIADAVELCRSLLEAKQVNLQAWTSLGQVIGEISGRFEKSKLLQTASTQTAANIPAPLLKLTQKSIKQSALGADMRAIFARIFDLLDYLKHIEAFMRRDHALKQTLPLFTLVHEEGRSLASLIKTRPLRIEGLDAAVSETLDSINYAITMELRKVFAHELVELSSLRQAPAIYVKVENAHGLLRDSFRQSAIGLAQLFDPSIEGSQLFDAFQTKLEQSLALRADLWTLLQLVRRAETDANSAAIRRLLDNLSAFYEGSLRYLMYKDWESCEHFMEEVGAARGPTELSPILHRFAAYLEALGNQVNMRAVLINHPFDYPPLADE